MKEGKKFSRWVKAHKTELILSGIGVCAIILAVVGIKNCPEIEEAFKEFLFGKNRSAAKGSSAIMDINEIRHIAIPRAPLAVASNSTSFPFEVRQHIRNLPEGWHASPEKIEQALKNGIILIDGQTWVDAYIKGGVVA